MQFIVVRPINDAPKGPAIFLTMDRWNDFSFVTQFDVSFQDDTGKIYSLGATKIGFNGQTTLRDTHQVIPETFTALGTEFFSLGQSLEFYKKIAGLGSSTAEEILKGLRDIVASPEIMNEVIQEEVLTRSLMRYIPRAMISGQFSRVLQGKVPLSDFHFQFHRPATEKFSDLILNFKVEREAQPSSNIHAIIGRNGTGKTFVLNEMIQAITNPKTGPSRFRNLEVYATEIDDDYFSSLVSVSFSAFDPFVPPKEQPDPAKGTCYYYVGLKNPETPEQHRTFSELRLDCAEALAACFQDPHKSERWRTAITKLSSDENFARMDLEELRNVFQTTQDALQNIQSDSSTFVAHFHAEIKDFLERMSSGHAIVLLTISRLVATVEEKTLVLLDEPESHLHPPLLSAFIRALSELLHDRNGVAIIATHSPVILQEIPKSCVLKILRVRGAQSAKRPQIETFGENVGTLTSEVFGLEVEKSGFHEVLANAVENGGTFESILETFNGQIGFEGKSVLKALLALKQSQPQ